VVGSLGLLSYAILSGTGLAIIRLHSLVDPIVQDLTWRQNCAAKHFALSVGLDFLDIFYLIKYCLYSVVFIIGQNT